MKLEFKHLAPYSPYKLNYFIDFEDGDVAVYEMIGLFSDSGEVYLDGYEANLDSTNCKPILRPLSDLTKEIEVDGCKFVPIMVLELDSHTLSVNQYSNHLEIRGVESNEWTYAIDVYTEIMCKLFEWHFDVFGLIEKGLAMDINTLNN